METSALTTANWQEFLTDSYYHGFLLKTLRVGAMTALLCGVLGYFPAYFIWATTFRHKWLLLLLLIVPFWISFTIRTFSWIHILGEQGVINVALLRLGLISEPLPMLYTEGAVIMGHAALPAALHDPQRLCQPRGHRPHAHLGGPLDGLHQRAGVPRGDAAAVAARPRRPACCSASCWPPAAM